MNNTIQSITPHMQVLKSAIFKPGIYEFCCQDGIEVLRHNLMLDFSGVVLTGGKNIQATASSEAVALHEEFSYADQTDETHRVSQLGFHGVGLTLKGIKNVTVKGLTVKGFELGVSLVDCENITLEDCNFSDNFHDPECGWNEHGAKGAIYLCNTHHCTIKSNRANNVWNGLYLFRSNYNTVTGNDFSHTSNMCVKMWNASHNVVDTNNLSWGLRIKPGEVHARDSAGLLMDSGCDYNFVRNNDITHGGDGLFLRVLNGWHSRFNVFENNDCSYANNNAIEAWSDSNTYIRNKANYSSYGFWMGGSDNTIMVENEACNNGKVFSNAPEAFGNCGIAVVNGSGHQFQMIGNIIADNNGPGMAVRFKPEYPIRHWVVEDNIISGNKTVNDYIGHGIYLKNCGLLSFSNNIFSDNDGEDICCDTNVFDIIKLSDGDDFVTIYPQFPVDFIKQGKSVTFSCESQAQNPNSIMQTRWDFGDTTVINQPTVQKVYETYGTFYAGVTVNTASRSAIKGGIINVVPNGADILPLIDDVQLYADDSTAAVVRTSDSVRCMADCCTEMAVTAHLSTAVMLGESNRFSFFLKLISDAETDWDRTVPSPIVTLIQDGDNKIIMTPKTMTSDGLFTEKTWEKFSYRFISMPIKQSDVDFTVEIVGAPTSVMAVEVAIAYKNHGKVTADIKACSVHTAAEICCDGGTDA